MEISPGLETELAIVVFIISFWIGLIGHELGHFLAARLISLPVTKFLVGRGPLLFGWKAGGTSFEFRLFPTRGFVKALPVLVRREYALIIFALGGVAANITLICLLGLFQFLGLFRDVPSSFLTAIYFGQAFHLLVLLPGPAKIEGLSIGTDGAQFFNLMFRKQPEITYWGDLYLQYVRRYLPQEAAETLKSPNASYLLFLMTRSDQWTDEIARREVSGEYQRLLSSGELSRAEEILVLEGLLTRALVYRDPVLMPRIEEWSARSLELAPDSRPLLATRGGVLAETGRYIEARSVMKPIVSTTDDANELFLCRAFLAWSELKLGNEKETFRYLWELRKALPGKAYQEYYLTRLIEIEAEALRTWPSSESNEFEASAA